MAHRTLFLIQTQLYPLTGGVSLRNWQNLNLMRTYGDVGVFSIYKGAAYGSGAAPVTERFSHWQHQDLTSPQRSLGEKVQRRLWRLRPDGNARADWLYSRAVAQQLRATLAKFRPTLIVVEEIWLFRYLPILKSWGCPVILDDHNVEGDSSRYSSGSTMTPLKLQKVRYIEQQFAQQVDQVWLCSSQDMQRLCQLYPRLAASDRFWSVPNGVNPEDYAALRAGTLSPPSALAPAPTLIYLGRFSYEPNAEAARLLLRDIFPAVKAQVANCRLLLVGCDPTEEMQRLAAQQSNVVVTGRVDDVRPYLAAASMMVVPLQKGSGTRLKLIEAFAAGCPVISTPKGAEGLAVEDGQHLRLTTTSAEMVQAIQQLLQSPQQAQQLADNAYQLFLHYYAWPAVNQQIQTALNALFAEPHQAV